MRKSKCKWCVEGAYLDPRTDKVISRCFCELDSYDPDIGCSYCHDYERKEEKKEVVK